MKFLLCLADVEFMLRIDVSRVYDQINEGNWFFILKVRVSETKLFYDILDVLWLVLKVVVDQIIIVLF